MTDISSLSCALGINRDSSPELEKDVVQPADKSDNKTWEEDEKYSHDDPPNIEKLNIHFHADINLSIGEKFQPKDESYGLSINFASKNNERSS